jgi:hypothetical protein
VLIKDMTFAGDGSVNWSGVDLSGLVARLWSPSGTKFIAHASATGNMTMKDGDYAEVRLVEAIKGSGRSLVMMDTAAMAELVSGLNCLIQKFEKMESLADDDVIKLAKIKNIKEQMLYCRQSALKE